MAAWRNGIASDYDTTRLSKKDVRKALNHYIWGQSPLPHDEGTTGPLKANPDTVMSKAFKEAVFFFDYCIPPFFGSSIGASSSSTSTKASKNIPQGQLLTEIRCDGSWMNTLVDWCLNQLPEDPLKNLETKHQNPIKGYLYYAAYSSPDKIREHAEAETNIRTQREIDVTRCVLKCLYSGISITCLSQVPIKIGGSGITVRVDQAMQDNNQGKLIARYEDKTALVQFYHARSLHRTRSSIFGRDWDEAIKGIYQEAYVPGQPDYQDSSRIVRMGNTALYLWAYTGPGFLAVSNWRSIDPAHAQQLLEQLYPRDHLEDPFLVEQGNPVLENMALYMLHHDLGIDYWLDEHLRSMSPNHFPSARRIRDDTWAILLKLGILGFIGHLTLCINGSLDQFLRNHLQSARISDLGDDIWTTFCDIFSGKIYKSINIGSTSFIGYLTSYDKDLEKSFGFFTPGSWTLPLKETAVWSNGKWVVKKVTTKERSAMEDLHGLYGIVPLGGIFHVTVGWHKGTDFLFTRFKGKPVEDISNGRVRTAVVNALQLIHQKSWHHHDVHEGNVLEDDDGEITLIDFDFAVRAHECLDPDQCPDAPYLYMRKSDAELH
ncbi:hypothetical protein C0992_010192 [Termitomyces sp. T32_za158]|nr:hypothetical protein C0992_010192 [Termitomyces sp. T32_za158]